MKPKSKVVTLPPQQLPVIDHYDVIVVGAGLAGCCAAIAAARSGGRTLLIESMPFVGGNGATGLPITTFCAAGAQPPRIVAGIAQELMERLRQCGGFDSDLDRDDWMAVDSDRLQIVLAQMLDDAGVTLLCHSPLLAVHRDGRILEHVVVLGKDDLRAYGAACFVDCSGDAALAYKAGLTTPMGRARDGRTQPMTLTFDVADVDEQAFARFGGCAAMAKRWNELRAAMNWRNPRSALSCPTFIPGRRGYASFNVTRILVEKGTDARQLTDAEREGRYQAEEFVDRFLRVHVPGFARCWLARIASRVGVRETRRITGEYELQGQDVIGCRKFDDAIACNSYPVDIHSPTDGQTQYDHTQIAVGAYYTIPYRSLVARDVDNLLAAGRCLSASHEAQAAVRVLSCAMPMGQAAGVAAAMVAARGVPARLLPVEDLRQALRAQGAIVA